MMNECFLRILEKDNDYFQHIPLRASVNNPALLYNLKPQGLDERHDAPKGRRAPFVESITLFVDDGASATPNYQRACVISGWNLPEMRPRDRDRCMSRRGAADQSITPFVESITLFVETPFLPRAGS